MILDFYIKISAENIFIFSCDYFSFLIIPCYQIGRDHPSGAGRHGDKPVPMLVQKLQIDPRLIIKTFRMTFRDKLHQILIAGIIFCKQNKMMINLSLAAWIVDLLTVIARTFGYYIYFAADNRLNASGFCRLIKIVRAEHHAMIGQGDSRHLILLRSANKSFNALRSIEK